MTPGTRERPHELRPERLAHGMLMHERLELSHDVGVAPERELGVDPAPHAAELQLVEPQYLCLGEGLAPDIREARPPPQHERVAEGRRGARGVAGGQRGSALLAQRRRALCVQRAGRRPQCVPGRLRHDRIATERRAQPSDHDVQRVLGMVRQRRRPERVHRLLERDHRAVMHEEQREQGPLPSPRDRAWQPVVTDGLDGAEDPVRACHS